VEFDGSLIESMQAFGEPRAVEARWGRDIRANYDAAKAAAENLRSRENPVREELRTLIRRFRMQETDFRIYCHRRAVRSFESILDTAVDAPLESAAFLHSVRDYRETPPFEILVKVGPLRARGWGAAPDAIVTAPRFATLWQIVWSGCSDEADFGYDPVSAIESSQAVGTGPRRGGISWVTRVTRSGSTLPEHQATGDVDELTLFRELTRMPERHRATLIQIDDEHGILYPPHAKILSFDPDPNVAEPLDRRMLGETLVEGMYVVRPVLSEVDLGGLRAEHGHYSQTWKARLVDEWRRDGVDLVQRLRMAGLDLVHLRGAIGHWCKPPSSVIHAPQRARHFEILIRVLGVDFDAVAAGATPRRGSWWRYAWEEIRRSRGEAIQAGVQGQEIVEEQLMLSLNTVLPALRANAAQDRGFVFPIPLDHGLQGSVSFGKVFSIEDGFFPPDSELRVVREVDALEQWRA
jgi:hypothetical protein